MLLHIPHSKKYIPVEYQKYFHLSDNALDYELLKMTDHFTDELFERSQSNCRGIIFPVSRLLVDPERFVIDADEPMSARGMGCIYDKTHDQKPLKDCNKIRQNLIDCYYVPHHKQFTDLVNHELKQAGHSLIIDCHSFPKYPLPYEMDQTSDRAEICIGTDDFHTPHNLADKVADGFDKAGFSIALNEPFAGAIVPIEHYRNSENVTSIMIEIRRDLYMDEASGRKTENFDIVKRAIGGILESLAQTQK
jgi:N-formylglutamate amidohydrolase